MDNQNLIDAGQAKQPLVSIIMNCFNGEKYLREAIESVLAQTYQNWEIIFWDNRSTDDSAEVFQEYSDPRFRYFLAESFTSLGQARNLAIEKPQGEFIAFLDCDDLWLPAKLGAQISLFDDPETDLVYCDVESFNTRGQSKRLGAGKNFERGRCFGALLADYFLVLSSVVIRRSTLECYRIRFRENYDMVEEADVFLRLAYYGRIDFVDKVLAKWRVHGASGVWSRFHLLADETEHMFEAFRRDWPGVAQEYEWEFHAREVWIVRQRAVALWMKGDGKGMRALLQKCRMKLPMSIRMLYFASWFNAKRWVPIMYRLFGANIAP